MDDISHAHLATFAARASYLQELGRRHVLGSYFTNPIRSLPPSSFADTAYINTTARMKGCTGEPGDWVNFNDKSFKSVALKANGEPVVSADAYVMLFGRRE